jgi:hypothetical protein
MKTISIHCSIERFLNEYENQLDGLVNTIRGSDIIVEGCIKLSFGVGGYYPSYTRELIDAILK